MSIWARYALGWTDENMSVLKLDDLKALNKNQSMDLRLEQSGYWGGDGTNNAIRVSLPDKFYSVNLPHSGVWEWFGGKT